MIAPVSIRIVVVLPAPDGPMIPRIVPRGTVRSMPLRTSRSSKRRETPRIATMSVRRSTASDAGGAADGRPAVARVAVRGLGGSARPACGSRIASGAGGVGGRVAGACIAAGVASRCVASGPAVPDRKPCVLLGSGRRRPGLGSRSLATSASRRRARCAGRYGRMTNGPVIDAVDALQCRWHRRPRRPGVGETPDRRRCRSMDTTTPMTDDRRPRPACATRATTGPGSPAAGPAAASRTATPTADRSATAETLDRIRAIAIPPAWTDVWICPWPNGHLQATGRDARGRKQYRYHPRYRARRDAAKFERLIAFARALPAIREQVERDLARPGLPREKVARGRRPAARADPDPGRQRRVRPAQPVVRPDDAARPPRPRRGHARSRSGSAASPASSTRSACAIGGWPASSGAAATCPARSSSSTSTRTASRATSRRTT